LNILPSSKLIDHLLCYVAKSVRKAVKDGKICQLNTTHESRVEVIMTNRGHRKLNLNDAK